MSVAAVTLRPATPDDYAAFVRLCPELGTGDPIPDPRVARELLAAMRLMVPNDHSVNLVAEDDEPLAALLLQTGAVLNLEILHMTGAL